MTPFATLTAVAVPLDMPNVDTDRIIPARFLGRTREEQVQAMFHDLKHDTEGRPVPGFVLNRPEFAGARILVADRNFGCGSSREHAVTTLVDNGFLAFVAPSFGDIFHNNCFQNGALPVRLPETRVAALRALLAARPGATMTVDLVRQVVVGPDGVEDRFETDPFRRDCLLNGVDDIGLTLRHAAQIEAFEAKRRAEPDWA
ncbi:MAG: 3-isopropylmalate dehydratase small subunit [Burkholderiales bacterium]|jgi:3-isopropylmalate/(R)-2-methylmalate dehydratase small subunit